MIAMYSQNLGLHVEYIHLKIVDSSNLLALKYSQAWLAWRMEAFNKLCRPRYEQHLMETSCSKTEHVGREPARERAIEAQKWH